MWRGVFSQWLWWRAHRVGVAYRRAWRVLLARGPSQLQFWFIALAIGVAAGLAALGFRKGIIWVQSALYGSDNVQQFHSYAQSLPWYWLLAVPTFGGLCVGLLLHRFTAEARAHSVADVIEAAALREGRVDMRTGAVSALASLITLGAGGSSGREGPVVHMAAVISTWVSHRIGADGITGRDLMGCAVAAAVSASFNAPIAGALFALEVILRHFAVHAFAPVVIASAAGAVISRLEFGDVAQFVLPAENALQFYQELPAFLMLGGVCGLVAVAMMRAIFWGDGVASRIQKHTGVPRWLRPMVAGVLLGGLAIWYPHIIGVGYETTSAALSGEILLREAIIFVILKAIALTITLAGRMGGGVFSPSLMVGALTGLSFGWIATAVFPNASGAETLYALAGMGAVAAAVLGAPISTILIVFELTGDWQTGLAVMVSVSVSTMLSSRLVVRSFFLTQLERRHIRIAAGPHSYVLSLLRVGAIMRKPQAADAATIARCQQMIAQGTRLPASATLETALPMLDGAEAGFLPVLAADMREEEGEAAGASPVLVGILYHIDALKAYNHALAATAAEEHS
ncbi:MAG: chloride channel protein [Rhodobacteraceae bacterium]|nr:chloride channel protein [Paracoccaceae bacterium]